MTTMGTRSATIGRLTTALLMAVPAVSVGCGEGPFVPNYVPPTPVFSNPTAITNTYLPLGSLTQDILEGTEGSATVHVVRSRLAGTKTFTFNSQQVQTAIVADSAFENGELVEVALDYFAQSDDGDVYYFGEDVDIYQSGQVVGHEGAWLFGVDTDKLGILLPASPAVGQKYRSEDVPGVTSEDDEVVAVGESVTVPAGTFQNCVRVKEILSDGAIEYKLFAPNVGVVREIPANGDLRLMSHT